MFELQTQPMLSPHPFECFITKNNERWESAHQQGFAIIQDFFIKANKNDALYKKIATNVAEIVEEICQL